MELAVAQMQESKASLDSTVHKLETNVEKISSSVELIAKLQHDLQKKFETFMETTQSSKQQHQADIKTLIQNEHVYPQLDALLAETTDRVASIENYLNNKSTPPSSSYESDSDDELNDHRMDTSMSTDMTGRKHHGSPS